MVEMAAVVEAVIAIGSLRQSLLSLQILDTCGTHLEVMEP